MEQPFLTPADLEAVIRERKFHTIPGTTAVVCELVTHFNGFKVYGIAPGPMNPANHDFEMGCDIAFDNAFEQLWQLMAFHRAARGYDEKVLPVQATADMRLPDGVDALVAAATGGAVNHEAPQDIESRLLDANVHGLGPDTDPYSVWAEGTLFPPVSAPLTTDEERAAESAKATPIQETPDMKLPDGSAVFQIINLGGQLDMRGVLIGTNVYDPMNPAHRLLATINNQIDALVRTATGTVVERKSAVEIEQQLIGANIHGIGPDTDPGAARLFNLSEASPFPIAAFPTETAADRQAALAARLKDSGIDPDSVMKAAQWTPQASDKFDGLSTDGGYTAEQVEAMNAAKNGEIKE